MLSVVTWLWDDPTYRWNAHFRYGVEHVKILRAAVARNLTLEHEFVLVTDRPEGDYGPDVRVVPLWSDYRELTGWRGKGHGCWHRLKAFDELTGQRLGERFVWLDLDCVVTGNLDSLFSRTEDFVAWRDANPPTPYCGSMVMMTAGARQRVWDEFDANPDRAQARCREQRYIGTDQAWIGTCLGPGEATWGPEHGVYNFRHDLKDGTLPSNAKLVFFTGPVDPSQPELQAAHPWIKEHWRD